jgi:hypothetical protein
VDNFVDTEEEQAVEEEGVEDAHAAEEAMTVGQLKHDLQVRGLTHLYVSKKGIKKADQMGMFLAPSVSRQLGEWDVRVLRLRDVPSSMLGKETGDGGASFRGG